MSDTNSMIDVDSLIKELDDRQLEVRRLTNEAVTAAKCSCTHYKDFFSKSLSVFFNHKDALARLVGNCESNAIIDESEAKSIRFWINAIDLSLWHDTSSYKLLPELYALGFLISAVKLRVKLNMKDK